MRESHKKKNKISHKVPPLVELDTIDELEVLNEVDNFLEGKNIPLKKYFSKGG
jgi:hypothetical protein